MDITKLMYSYRECARNLWNTHLMDKNSSGNIWNVFDQYCKICAILFNIIVLTPIDRGAFQKAMGYEQYPEPLPFLKIVPTSQSCINLLVNREKRSSGYWDYPFDSTIVKNVDLLFIDFFDFDLHSIRDFEYYLVRIVNASGNNDLVGRDALIRCSYATVQAIQHTEENEHVDRLDLS